MSGIGYGQNWDWEWSDQNTQKDAAAWTEIMDIDFQNNIYTGTMFGDSIFFRDTLFTSEGHYDWANWAIAKYDEQGNFQTAFDITSMPNKSIFEVDLVTDKNLNIYIACQFQEIAYLLDTTIHRGNVKEPDSPELFLVKLTPGFTIEWIHLISSNAQDVCQGLAISPDNYLYMATKQIGNAGENDTVSFMGQDTAIFNTSLCSLLKIDFDGILVWRKELKSSMIGVEVREVNITNANNILLNGHVRDNLFYSDDTIIHPHQGEYMHRPFFIEIDSSGALSKGKIKDWNMVVSDTDRDESGDIFFAGFVWDTVYFGTDTLIRHEDTTVNIIAKLNADYEPEWFETAKARTSQGSYYFHIDTFQDTLFFAGRCKGTIPIFDTVFNLGSPYKGFIGRVSPNGKLDKFIIAKSSGGLQPHGLKVDNCGDNLIVSGRFSGHAYLGQDTIESYSTSHWDGIVTKLYMHDPYHFDFGPDTTVCDSIRLTGPEGYKYYYWNGQVSEQNWFDVFVPGTYVFACTNEDRCWVRDTINIGIQPGFTINLGQDTVIGLTDTLRLSAPEGYESYLWSTGSTENSIEITGISIGQGDWSVWVAVTQGVCTITDTIHLTVSFVRELQEMGVSIYPNPAGDILHVFSEKYLERIEIYDNKGSVVISKKIQNAMDNRVKLNLSNIPPGIYLIRIYFDGYAGNGKIIKL